MKNNLKVARKAAGYTQEQVALILNSAQYQIYKYETGKQDITLQKATQLAELYNVSLDYLAGRTDKKEVNR